MYVHCVCTVCVCVCYGDDTMHHMVDGSVVPSAAPLGGGSALFIMLNTHTHLIYINSRQRGQQAQGGGEETHSVSLRPVFSFLERD